MRLYLVVLLVTVAAYYAGSARSTRKSKTRAMHIANRLQQVLDDSLFGGGAGKKLGKMRAQLKECIQELGKD